MKVFIAGMDGYLGWALTTHLVSLGYEVSGCDAFHRRRWVRDLGSNSLIPIPNESTRARALWDNYSILPRCYPIDLTDYTNICDALATERPHAVVHLAEQPSAPYSMRSRADCVLTQHNNVTGTLNLIHAIQEHCPRAHLVKLGTMGEYGTPDIDIPEGYFEVEYRGRKDRLPFPKQAGSWYHLSKVHDTNNIAFACKIMNLRATDIMQGVVYGTDIPAMNNDPKLSTRFDYDHCFGTVINRFCVQAVAELPLTVYGKGTQQRGFIPLRDSMRCITLALENPAEAGEHRVFNQFAQVRSILNLAYMVERHSGSKVSCVDNPRVEAERHYYNPDCTKLCELGYQPSSDIEDDIAQMIQRLHPFRDRIKLDVITPHVRWSRTCTPA